jgi:UDP-glucose 4-epimerase
LRYYDNNVNGSLVLLAAMQRAEVRRFVFSSSATIYGHADVNPIPETAAPRTTNVYGRSKLMVEDILRDLHPAASGWSIALLRYFNPVGAHPSGLIGEDPNGIPNNLMPYVTQVAVGRLAELQVFGGDYPTPDGTGVRDYIHVMDLAEGHRAALDWALHDPREILAANLGTGQGCSVLELVRAFEQASGRAIPHRIVARRAGDVAPAGAIRRWPGSGWAGRQRAVLKTCAAMPGTGSATTRRASPDGPASCCPRLAFHSQSAPPARRSTPRNPRYARRGLPAYQGNLPAATMRLKSAFFDSQSN